MARYYAFCKLPNSKNIGFKLLPKSDAIRYEIFVKSKNKKFLDYIIILGGVGIKYRGLSSVKLDIKRKFLVGDPLYFIGKAIKKVSYKVETDEEQIKIFNNFLKIELEELPGTYVYVKIAKNKHQKEVIRLKQIF